MVDESREELLRRLFDTKDKLLEQKKPKKRQDHFDWGFIATKHGFDNEYDLLNTFYHDKALSLRDISTRIDVPVSTIRYRLRKNKISLRPKGGPNNVRGKKKVESMLSLIGDDFDELLSKYGGSIQGVAKALNVSESTIRKYRG